MTYETKCNLDKWLIIKSMTNLIIDRVQVKSIHIWSNGLRNKFDYLKMLLSAFFLMIIAVQPIVHSQNTIPFYLNGLQMLQNKPFLDLCTIGPRLKITALGSFNGTHGVQFLFEDTQSNAMYTMKVPYFQYNWMPAYEQFLLEKTTSRVGDRSEISIGRLSAAYGDTRITSHKIAVRDYVLFEKVNTNTDTKALYRMVGFSNELIGCPPILCYNPTLDAGNYHVQRGVYQYFRGFYYWEEPTLVYPGVSNAKLIVSDFEGAPPFIDAVTSIPMETELYMMARENIIFLSSLTGGIMWEMSITDLFPSSTDFNDQYFLDDIIRYGNSTIFLALGNNFCTFQLTSSSGFFPLSYEFNGCNNLNTNGMLSYIDAAITAPKEHKQVIYIFNDWNVYEFQAGEFSKGIKESAAMLTSIATKTQKFTHLFWSCDRNMYRGFVSDRKQYEETYVELLSKKHEATKWNLIKSGYKTYDMQMIYVIMSVITTFLAICYGLLIFIGVFYCIMSESIRNKIKRKGGEKPLAPENVTPEAILAGKVTASQLLNAGMISPSTLQNMTSKASKIGPEYTSGMSSKVASGTGSKMNEENKSKVGSAIKSNLSSKTTPSKTGKPSSKT